MGPTGVLVQDLCHFGLLEILTEAHKSQGFSKGLFLILAGSVLWALILYTVFIEGFRINVAVHM